MKVISRFKNLGRYANGFTLIELIVVVAMVGILAAVAYPSYMGSVTRARRADATTTLLQDAQILERCYSQSFSYTTTCLSGGTSPAGYYTISVQYAAAAPFNTYTLTATPVSGGAQSGDAACTTFTLDNRGVQGSTGTGGSKCWQGK